MSDERPAPHPKPTHGHTGPTTPAEDASREATAVPPEDKAKIAEEASREEDA